MFASSVVLATWQKHSIGTHAQRPSLYPQVTSPVEGKAGNETSKDLTETPLSTYRARQGQVFQQGLPTPCQLCDPMALGTALYKNKQTHILCHIPQYRVALVTRVT